MNKNIRLLLFGLILLMFTGGAMGAPSLSGEGISPGSGTVETNFIFAVTYTDPDNLSASFVNVTIDAIPYPMTEVDPSDVNTSDGKAYRFEKSGFSVNPAHSYAFSASNANGAVGPYGAGTFAVTNTAPVLSSPLITPSSGSPATEFVFTVTYTDADNHTASYVNAVIDGINYPMTAVDPADTNTTDGKGYTLSNSSMAAGSHTYSFTASDGTTTATPTSEGTFSVNSDSSLSGTISSASGTPSTTFVFNAIFTDADNDAASSVTVTIDGTDYVMSEVDATDVTTTDGKAYTYSMSGFSAGSHSYSFKATVGSDTIGPVGAGTFDVDVSNHAPTLTDASVTGANNFIVGGVIYFNVTYTDSDNQLPTYSYVQIDGVNKTMSKVNSADNDATNGIEYTYNTTLAQGNHTYVFYMSDGTNPVSTASATITIHPKTYYTGDRIWDEDAGQSTTYTWNAKSFSGFFYDLETGFSSETMTITDISRTIGDGKLVYETRPVDSNFEHSAWGKYQVIGFMAEKYFAGYKSSITNINGVSTVSLISSGQLSKVLIDNDDKKSVYSGSSLTLEDGYKLNIVQVDKNGDKVFVTLTKDGDELDSGIISGSGDYVYEADLGDSDDVPIIIVHFDSIFSGTESNAVFIQGIFQISEDYVELEDGGSYGEMEITGFSDDYIQMKNDGSISLSKGKTIDIMGKIKFIVADSNTLRFALFVDMSSPGTYELRGTVAEGADLLTWTPLNFEGFYYDIDEGIQTEKLELKVINDRSIPKNQLVYTSTPAQVSFEHSDWGKYNVIGFMAEKYFAGYPSGAFGSSSSVDIISDGLLSKVLIDEDDKKSVYSGSALILEEGYTLNIVQVDKNGDKVMVTLTRDGKEVDTSIISGSGTYIYETDLGDSDDVPIIAIHFDSIFSGTESNAVFVKGIFQISEDYLEIEDGDTFGKMEVTGIGGSITMSNKDSISLSKGKSTALMGDISINVADSGSVRYYPYVEVTTAPSQTLSVSLDKSIATKGDKVTVTVTSRGAAVSDATVKAGSSTIGTTSDEGKITYTASTIGKLQITASKDNYASGSSELEVISPDDDSRKIIIEVSPEEVYEGSSVTFFVLKAIGGDAVEGATVSYDGKSIGSTSSDGTITYTVADPGMHKLTAVKSGFIDASMNLEVKEIAAKFEFTNLVITPLDIKQGKEATFNVDVRNTGTAEGSYTVDLKVNDTVVGTQTITLAIGESQTLSFKHAEKEPGTYVVKVADLTTTYEVFEKSGVIWYVLGAIAVVFVGGLGYLFTAGGWTAEIAQAKVDEAIQTLQELVSKR
ncbi:S-layer-like domain-containing protein [Methanolobus psychrophilus R15]|nr:S-layer-like domain-containing protein [Methanolobus psychrophilus R15]